MKFRPFGQHGFNSSEIGFGAWAIGGNGWGSQADTDSLAALHRALDLGCNFIDTAGKKENVFVATKTPPTAGTWPPSPYDRAADRFPETYLRENLAERLACLGVEKLDLLQLHTWTRAWNRDPAPFKILRALQREGKIGLVGVSTPEHDQNCVIDLMRGGWVDSVQVIYNLFEQEPAAELLDVAKECGVGIIVRVAFDEGVLTGKFTVNTRFATDDFRHNYFAGDRLSRAVIRTEKIRHDLEGSGYTLPQAALKWVLAHPAVSTVIPGIRNVAQADANCGVSDLPAMPAALVEKLRRHNWRRAFWYGGK